MEKNNSIYIGVSLDGYIADPNDGLDWLDLIPNPEGIDMGYYQFMSGIDALVMGRRTFEVLCGFGIEWPYKKPVFVLSNTLSNLSEEYKDKAFVLNGNLAGILQEIHDRGYNKLYIDGGVTAQNFLKEDLIDEMVITTIPVLLGGGIPLFGALPRSLEFELVASTVYLDHIVQNHYKRKRT